MIASAKKPARKRAAAKTAGPAQDPPHGKFLVVVDETPESLVALRFAGLSAARRGGRVVLLMVLEPATFHHWLGVGAIMKEEARAEAMSVMRRLAGEIKDFAGIAPQIVLREGSKAEELAAYIAQDGELTALVLGAGTGAEGPGPLVAALAGREAGGRFVIPVVIVPGDLTAQALRALV